MFKIGKNIEVKGKVVLAPMAGVTFYAYRKFMADFDVDVFYSEMVSDCGLIYANEETLKYLKTDKEEHPFGVQLFGNDKEKLIEAMKICLAQENKPDFFDINAGCPVPKVTNSGSGSALLKDLDHLYDMMKALCDFSPIPVTIKIRLGWDDNSINYKEAIKLLEKAGVSLIALHARTRKQLYTGQARYELIKNLRDEMTVPLVISGDIFTLDDAIKALEITHADAVMVARGAMGNPKLCKQINHYFKTGERLPDATLNEQKDNLYKLASMMVDEYGEEKAFRLLRTIGPKFFNGFKNSRLIKSKITYGLHSLDELKEAMDNYDFN